MAKSVMLRSVWTDGSRTIETCRFAPAKFNHPVSRSRAGGGSVFRRLESVHACVERAIEGNRPWGGR